MYLLRSTRLCRTYIGVTCDLERRLQAHNGERLGGARATRAGRPWQRVACLGPLADRAQAQQLEARLKKIAGARREIAFAQAQKELDQS